MRAIHANECEAARRVAISSGGTFQDLADQARHHVRIGNLRGNRKGGIHRHAHGQRIQVAIKDLGAAGADFDNQPLLVLCA